MSTKPASTTAKKSCTSHEPSPSTEDTLHCLAFDHSLQPNIISYVGDGKIITANIAACELLGYSKNELLSKSRNAIFDIKESSFKKMLKERTAKGKSMGLVKAVKKDGNILPCEISSAVFIDDGVEKAVTTFVDIRGNLLKQKKIDAKKEKIIAANIVIAQTKSDVRLAKNNEWIKCIAKNSYDVMWDWDIVSGEIYVGDSIVEVFGYKVENNSINYKHLNLCLLGEEKNVIRKKLGDCLASGAKSWKDSFTFKRQDGSIASTICRASIVRDDDGKAIRMIGALQDISKLQELKNKLEEQRGSYDEAKASLDVLWEWNTLTNEVCTGEGFEKLLGYTNAIDNYNITDWRSCLHPDDKTSVEKGLSDAIESIEANWQMAHRLIKADDSTAKVFNRASIFRDESGKVRRLVGVMRYVTPQKESKGQAIALLQDKKSKLADRIKNVILDLIYHSHEKLQTNFSDYVSTKLNYDYTYLANLFSEVKGSSIQQYIITQKIERAKKLIKTSKLSLTQIASQLQYSSVAHLSNQFKKFTGLTPTEFKHNNN